MVFRLVGGHVPPSYGHSSGSKKCDVKGLGGHFCKPQGDVGRATPYRSTLERGGGERRYLVDTEQMEQSFIDIHFSIAIPIVGVGQPCDVVSARGGNGFERFLGRECGASLQP